MQSLPLGCVVRGTSVQQEIDVYLAYHADKDCDMAAVNEIKLKISYK